MEKQIDEDLPARRTRRTTPKPVVEEPAKVKPKINPI